MKISKKNKKTFDAKSSTFFKTETKINKYWFWFDPEKKERIEKFEAKDDEVRSVGV